MQNSLKTLNALLVINSQSSRVRAAEEMVRPYLDHFGVPYVVLDLLGAPLPANLGEYPLIILGHDLFDPDGKRLSGGSLDRLREAIRAGSGLVSFDPTIPSLIVNGQLPAEKLTAVDRLTIAGGHPISKSFENGQTISLCSRMNLASIVEGEVIASGNDTPLLSTTSLEKGRMVCWASMEWMHTSVLGPMGGLDSLLWRGIVWAARKPFCMRGLPPIVTMRVDDVAGWGGLWQHSPLYWVENAIDAGFKPWLGLFIYNLTPATVDQLRKMILDKDATAFPHAFGRPNRNDRKVEYYFENGLPLRSDTYDEFIYFDHQHGVPWNDVEAERGLDAVEDWYRLNGPLPMSRCALPHWYELGANTCERIYRKWGADILGKVMDADWPLTTGVSWPRLGPFRKYEDAGECFFIADGVRDQKPVYYADFYNLAGCPFFNTITEIRDDAGYEWAPDNDVEASIGRGVRQVRRALDSLALASLFTHETDFIYKIEPERWAEIIAGVAKGIASYHPIQLTLDDAGVYLRDVKTSRLTSCRLDSETGEILVTLEGKSEGNTHVMVFRDNETGSSEDIREVPAFEGFIVTSLS